MTFRPISGILKDWSGLNLKHDTDNLPRCEFAMTSPVNGQQQCCYQDGHSGPHMLEEPREPVLVAPVRVTR